MSTQTLDVSGVEIRPVPVGNLRIEPRYQRPLDAARVRAMASALDDTQLGVIEVHERADGSLLVLDGQHRARAVLEARGRDGLVLAHVVRGLSVAEEARRFLLLNKERVALSGYALWRARMAAGDDTVLSVERIVSELGLKTGQTDSEGTVRAVGALESIVKAHGVDVLRETLQVTSEAYGRSVDAFGSDLLRGVALVLDVYGDKGSLAAGLDVDLLAKKIAAVMPVQVVARAQALRDVKRGSVPRLVAEVIVGLYNKGRREGARLPDLPAKVKTSAASVRTRRGRDGGPTAQPMLLGADETPDRATA